ncbi:MAG: VWA domain-containing protein [Parasphingorhabdus sp.]|uniref:vWA domain-containing protein n=1 Tax=Parasphingorhabdus sp. TaxID=2709688 RepID=UPI003296B87C
MRSVSGFSKILSGIAAIGLIGTPISTPLDAQTRQGKRPDLVRHPPSHPVNCSLFEYRDRTIGKTGILRQRAGGPAASIVPPPPPPVARPATNAIGASLAPKRQSSVRPRPGPRPYPYPYPYPYPRPPQSEDREQYAGEEVANIKRVADEPVSTFAVDVDTGSYSNVRRFLNDGKMPPEAAVRTEELINYFRYDYPAPSSRSVPFSLTTDMSATPWNKASRLLRIGLRGYDADTNSRPRANLVFLVDVSGSMGSANKLPLVKSTLTALANELRDDDRVSIVVYSGTVGLLLAPTSNKTHIKEAVNCLYARGSTAGGNALKLAYSTARKNFLKGGINRIIMATDGDFNVGTSNTDQLKKIVAKERESGVNLTMLGYGTGNIRDELMEGIANVGNGNYAYIDSAMEAQKVLGDELNSTLFTIAKDVKIQIEFNPTHVKEYRLIGYENRLLAEEDFDNDKIDAGDIGAGHQVTALYEIMPAQSRGWLAERRYPANRTTVNTSRFEGELAHIKLRFKLPNGDKSRLIQHQISAQGLVDAKDPTGDMAFAIAVAAFGQKLRGDKYLGEFDFTRIQKLSGNGGNFWRQEFRKLNDLAQNQS